MTESAKTPVVSESIRVLVVDDEEDACRLMQRALSAEGWGVKTAGDGRRALHLLLQEPFEVLVVDLRMKEMDGFTFIEEALKIWPWLGVMIVTGYADDASVEHAKELGVTRVLQKPISLNDLKRNVREEAQERLDRVEIPAQQSIDQVRYQLSVLRQLTDSAMTHETQLEALRDISSGLGRLLPCSLIGVLSLEEDERVMMFSVVESVSEEMIVYLQSEMIHRYESLSGLPLPRETLRIQVEGRECNPEGPSEAGSQFTIPIVREGEVHGILTLATSDPNAYSLLDVSFFYHAANQISTVLTALLRMRELAVRDPLTGIYNRRYLREALDKTWSIAQRYEHDMAVLIVDVDHFKELNDTYGHIAGDMVLKETVELLQKVTRSSDIVGRFGGDEMVVILPETTNEGARAVASKIVDAIRGHVFCEDTYQLKATVSAGACSSDTEHLNTAADILSMADRALYVSKENGRDRFTVWSPEVGAVKDKTTATQYIPKPQAADIETEGGASILVVDDDPIIRQVLERLLSLDNHTVSQAGTIQEALDILLEDPDRFHIVLADLNLGMESGFDLLDDMKSLDESLMRIVITGNATVDNAIASLRHGAYDFIEKPIIKEQLAAVIDRALKYRRLIIENKHYHLYLEDMVRQKSAELSKTLNQLEGSYEYTLEALVAMLDAREYTTGQHSKRVKELTLVLGREIKLSDQELDTLGRGALLHDIGKIGIPDSILLKPGILTSEEREIMKKHCEIGYKILQSSPHLQDAADIVLSHQERFDGSGYPRSLKGREIPLGARIFAIVDVYDAMRSKRTYKRSHTAEEATEEITGKAGKDFDPELVDYFLRCQPKFEAMGNWEEENAKLNF
ncbi:MAG: diguanylate cyclase [Verrucomicrobia bacterium]|nr:diguanylate cyclase [Verrucomicrobiota bacterium]